MLYRTVDNVHLFLSEHLVHVPVDDTVAVTRGPALRVNEVVNKCDLQKIVRLSNKLHCYQNYTTIRTSQQLYLKVCCNFFQSEPCLWKLTMARLEVAKYKVPTKK